MCCDKFGRTASTEVGNGTAYRPLSSLEYNSGGLLSKQTYGNGNYITFGYDSLDRITEKKYNGDSNKRLTYAYGSDGSIARVSDFFTNSNTRYTYDLAGRITGIRTYNGTGPASSVSLKSYTNYTYADKTNYLTGIQNYSPLGTQNISYRYGNLANGEMPDQIYGVNWNGSEKVRYTYDGLGRLTNKSINGINNSFTYEDVNDTKTTTLVKSVETAAGTYTYTYDETGNIISINDGTNTTSYVYDELNQLIRTNNEKTGKTYTYSYTNGNITERKEYAYTIGELGEALDTKTWQYTDETWSDLLTNYDGKAITYDNIGNPIMIGDYSLSWNGRQLQSLTDGTTNVSYKYNGDGQRASKTVNGVTTEYFYNGEILAGQKSGNDVIVFMYDNNGDIFGFSYNGNDYYYIKNAQNDVVAIADSTGEVVTRYYYDSWGALLEISGDTEIADINPIRYRSYYYDYEFGLYYVSSRYYNPEIGRWINADSQLNQKDGIFGFNMFAYCHNNPIMYSDPTGHSITLACIIIGVVIGAVAGGGTGAYISKKQTGKVSGWAVAAGAVGGGVVGGLIGWGVGAAITAVGVAATGSAATVAAPVVQRVTEKASTALQTYYPPNDGFSGVVQKLTLEAGTLIQRTGDLGGRYIAPAGTPTQMLSLPYDKIGQPTAILQVQQSVEVLAGHVAPWFGQIGGGIQYQLGTPLDQLISEGIIKIFEG